MFICGDVNVLFVSVESPFESITTDAFGVSLGEIYTMMDPVGNTTTTDLGAFS